MAQNLLTDTDATTVAARLTDLRAVGGDALAERTLSNFGRHLAGLLAATCGWSREDLHRTVGLAGMLGFERLEGALRRAEDAEAPDAATSLAIRNRTQDALALIETLSGPGR